MHKLTLSVLFVLTYQSSLIAMESSKQQAKAAGWRVITTTTGLNENFKRQTKSLPEMSSQEIKKDKETPNKNQGITRKRSFEPENCSIIQESENLVKIVCLQRMHKLSQITTQQNNNIIPVAPHANEPIFSTELAHYQPYWIIDLK